jgi:hypothetical protein
LSAKNERKQIRRLFNKVKQKFNGHRRDKDDKIDDFDTMKASMEQIFNTECT